MGRDPEKCGEATVATQDQERRGVTREPMVSGFLVAPAHQCEHHAGSCPGHCLPHCPVLDRPQPHPHQGLCQGQNIKCASF